MLTTLRTFRDTYMLATPDRQNLVRVYNNISPRIVRAIPTNDPEWDVIGDELDTAVAMINRGEKYLAMNLYISMMYRLMSKWLSRFIDDGPYL